MNGISAIFQNPDRDTDDQANSRKKTPSENKVYIKEKKSKYDSN